MKNYQLIYYFITVPISKDEELIKKIITTITDELDQFDLQSNDTQLVTETHFRKLVLLSKLYLVSHDEVDTSFMSPIVINSKDLDEERDVQDMMN